MITKDDFVVAIRKTGTEITGLEPEFENFEGLVLAALKVRAAMPGIGFASVQKRMNCFLAVCRHLDSLVDDGELDLSESQFVLMILRLKDRKFSKAITMFDIRGGRYGAAMRAELPRSAREYLAGMEMFQATKGGGA